MSIGASVLFECLEESESFVSPLENRVLFGLSTGLLGVCRSSGGVFSASFGSDFREYSGRRRLSRFHFVVGNCFVEVCLLESSENKDMGYITIEIKSICMLY